MKKIIIILVMILIILVGVGALMWHDGFWPTKSQLPIPAATPIAIAQAVYICNGDKTIDATFYSGGTPPSVAPGQPPIPTGSIKVFLSDGRSYDLSQTISADGSRYATSDESFVFWSKGNGALVLENNIEKNYIGCIAEANDPGGLPKVYHDGTVGFSVRYPAGYLLNADYKYQELGPGKDISGVKFTIPASTVTGTNLGEDSGVSVESILSVQDCNAGLFLDGKPIVQTITDNGRDYSFASSTDAAAGNRYEENVWAVPGTNSCIAVRYFIHYGVIENYPSGTVREFNHSSLINQFDKIRNTLITL